MKSKVGAGAPPADGFNHSAHALVKPPNRHERKLVVESHVNVGRGKSDLVDSLAP